MPNLDVRFKARAAGVPLWKVARQLGIGDNTLFRKLRRELTAEEKKQFFDAIVRAATDQEKEKFEAIDKERDSKKRG